MVQVSKPSQGKPVVVTTNLFEISKLPTKQYIQYDVFKPRVKIYRKRQELIHKLQNVIAPAIFSPRAVYDGEALMYASRPLQLQSGNRGIFTVSLTSGAPAADARGSFEITVSQTIGESIDPSVDVDILIKRQQATNQAAVATNLLQLLIRQDSNQKYVNNNKAYFTPGGSKHIGSGIELWLGYFQSVRPAIGRMFVNIDTATSAVYTSGRLVDVCLGVIGSTNIRDLAVPDRHQYFRILSKHLNKLLINVKTIGQGRQTKTIYGIVPCAGRYKFLKGDQMITVAEYYRSTYNITLAYPDVFGVCLTPHKAPFPKIVPAELCSIIPGQLYKKRIPDHLTKAMVDFATTRPDDRLKQIQNGGNLESPVKGYQSSEFIAESGMTINAKPTSISGRILEAPSIKYKENDARPQDGAWNLVRHKLYNPQPMTTWAVVNFCPERISTGYCEKIMQTLLSSCGKLGMETRMPVAIEQGIGHAVEKALNNAVSKARSALREKLQISAFILLVILPSKASEIRTRVKHWGDIIEGVRTQCVREDKVTTGKDQYFNNIALKLNARLGGYNSLTDTAIMRELSKEPFIIMGADVGHPAPQVNKPSITSLVWSHDRYATQYAAFTRIQHPRVEIIDALKDMVKDAILAFGSKNKRSPSRIVFFRDGVSEGEFRKVAGEEISAIKAAFDEVWSERNLADQKPKLTFIVVGKRHHVVFFPQDQSARDKTGNCRAGFVADQGISHPIIPDFYLQSHAAVKGTSRSSHYSVLLDENFHLNLDKLQELAFALCHVYAKATRSVSIPAPVYYADLVCSRGDFHFHPDSDLTFEEASTVTSGSQTFDLSKWEAGFLPTNRNSSRSMYFL